MHFTKYLLHTPLIPMLCMLQHDNGELDGSEMCDQLGIEKWFYVSANTGENVDEAFEYLIKKVTEHYRLKYLHQFSCYRLHNFKGLVLILILLN